MVRMRPVLTDKCGQFRQGAACVPETIEVSTPIGGSHG